MQHSFIDALLGLSEGLAGINDLGCLRQLATAGVSQLSRSQVCWLWLLDQGGTTLRPGATSGIIVPPWRWRVPLQSEKLVARCLADGRPTLSEGPGGQNGLCVPLLGPIRYVGAFVCYRDAAQPYQDWEAEELGCLANFLGPLVGDARFCNELGEIYSAALGVLITALGLAHDRLRDRAETAMHLAVRLAWRLNLSSVAIRSVQWGSLFYEVGPTVADRWFLSPRDIAAGVPRTVLAQGPLALLPGLELCLERIAGACGMGLEANEAALGARVVFLTHEFIRLTEIAQISAGMSARPVTADWYLNTLYQVLDTLRRRQHQAWDGTVIETLSELLHGAPQVAGAPAGLWPPLLSWIQTAKAA